MAHERQVRGLRDLEPSVRRASSLASQRPASTGTRRSRAPWRTTAASIDPGHFAAQVRVAKQREPRRKRTGRRRAALGEQDGEFARPVAGPGAALRIQVHEPAQRLRGLGAQALGKLLERCAAPSHAANRAAARNREWCSRAPAPRPATGAATRAATQRVRPGTSRRRGHCPASIAATASTTPSRPSKGCSRECPWPGRSTTCRRKDFASLAAIACQMPPCSPHPCSSTRSGPAPTRSTCSAIREAPREGPRRAPGPARGNGRRKARCEASPCRPERSAGESAGTSWPSSRRRAESLTARRASPTITGWIAVVEAVAISLREQASRKSAIRSCSAATSESSSSR